MRHSGDRHHRRADSPLRRSLAEEDYFQLITDSLLVDHRIELRFPNWPPNALPVLSSPHTGVPDSLFLMDILSNRHWSRVSPPPSLLIISFTHPPLKFRDLAAFTFFDYSQCLSPLCMLYTDTVTYTVARVALN